MTCETSHAILLFQNFIQVRIYPRKVSLTIKSSDPNLTKNEKEKQKETKWYTKARKPVTEHFKSQCFCMFYMLLYDSLSTASFNAFLNRKICSFSGGKLTFSNHGNQSWIRQLEHFLLYLGPLKNHNSWTSLLALFD